MNDDGLTRLYASIFKQALNDDKSKEKANFISDGMKINESEAKVKKLFQEKYAQQLESLLQNKIYEETHVWPDRDISREHQYKKRIADLKLEFLKEVKGL